MSVGPVGSGPREDAEDAPEFGVIIPTRNRPRELERAVDSLLRQEWTGWRAVIADDASDDRYGGRIRETAGRDDRIRLLRLPSRRGAAVARNLAAAECSARYLAFMDDDCWWAPDRLSRLHGALSAAPPGVRHAYTRMISVTPTGESWTQGTAGGGPFPGAWHVGTPMLVVDRLRFHEVGGFDERLRRLQDFDLALRLTAAGDALFVPDAPAWTERIGGISEDLGAFQAAASHLASKYRGDSPLARSERALMHRMLAFRSMELGVRGCAIRHYGHALRSQPTSLVAWAALISALAGPRAYHAMTRLIEKWRGTER